MCSYTTCVGHMGIGGRGQITIFTFYLESPACWITVIIYGTYNLYRMKYRLFTRDTNLSLIEQLIIIRYILLFLQLCLQNRNAPTAVVRKSMPKLAELHFLPYCNHRWRIWQFITFHRSGYCFKIKHDYIYIGPGHEPKISSDPYTASSCRDSLGFIVLIDALIL